MPPTFDSAFDLLVVGGGINGVGIARDAVGRGLKVALVERSDLAAGTSSASTKLIHGGLRYLEHFELRLVRESLIERERLLRIAPHLVHPMEFVLPHVEGLRPRWEMRIGLFLYDHLGTRERLPKSRAVRIANTPYGEPLSRSIRFGFTYADCWVDDSRLVVLNALDATERGAKILTRTELIAASRNGNHWHAELRDTTNGKTSHVRARAIVNASGPWVEKTIGAVATARPSGHVRLVKGSHIVVPRIYAGSHAFMLQNPDGRIGFTIPYENEFTLIGTTDVPFEGDVAAPAISDAEIAYLCDTVNRHFKRPISPADVRWTYAGIRPLLDDAESNASKVTRDYRLELSGERSEPPVLSIFGGKITTYRRLAETALDKLHPYIGGSRRSWTDRTPLPGGDFPRGDFAGFVAGARRRWPFLSQSLATRLARAYGTRLGAIIGNAKRIEDFGAQLGVGFTEAELDYLRTHEWARTAEDVLWRRSKLGLHMSNEERELLARQFERAPV